MSDGATVNEIGSIVGDELEVNYFNIFVRCTFPAVLF